MDSKLTDHISVDLEKFKRSKALGISRKGEEVAGTEQEAQ
jgi:hypothetical protein